MKIVVYLVHDTQGSRWWSADDDTSTILVPYFSFFFFFGFITVCQNGPRRISLQISLHHTLHLLCGQVLPSIPGIHEYEYIVFCVDTFFGHLEVRVLKYQGSLYAS